MCLVVGIYITNIINVTKGTGHTVVMFLLLYFLYKENPRKERKDKMLKINTIGLFVNDMNTMVSFYRDVMGMKTDWEGTANAELFSDQFRLIMFSRDDFEAMTSREYSYPKGINGTVELAFDTADFADVDAEYNRIVKAGATPVYPPADQPWGQRTSYVADPDGNLIEISSFVK